MFDAETINEAHKIAARLGVTTSSLLAVAEVESGGKAFAIVDGKPEPLIRWEGHYFDQRLTGEDKASARALGLASPKAGKVPNPSSQSARYALLARAAEINAQAAYESCSWGLGQVMGSHWKHLGFKSVDALVTLARKSVGGQMELMARFIEKNGLVDELRGRNWAAFAKAYNGPAYKKNAYDTKMKNADTRWAKKLASGKVTPPAALVDMTKRQASSVMRLGSKGEFVKQLQTNLDALGYGPLEADGIFGQATEVAVKQYQKDNGLTVDGWAGPGTLGEIGKDLNKQKTAPKLAAAKTVVEEAANGDRNYSSTEITAGVTGLSGAVASAKLVVDQIEESANSFLSLATTVGPWLLLGLVVIGGAGYIYWARRKQRIKATEVREEL